MGELLGGIVGVYILQLIWEKLVFMRLADDPLKGKMGSTVAAYISAAVIYGFATANGGPWRPVGFVAYLLGLLVVGAYSWSRGNKLRDAMREAERHETFS